MFRFHILERVIFSKILNVKYQFTSIGGRKLTELTILLSLPHDQTKPLSYFTMAAVVMATTT